MNDSNASVGFTTLKKFSSVVNADENKFPNLPKGSKA